LVFDICVVSKLRNVRNQLRSQLDSAPPQRLGGVLQASADAATRSGVALVKPTSVDKVIVVFQLLYVVVVVVLFRVYCFAWCARVFARSASKCVAVWRAFAQRLENQSKALFRLLKKLHETVINVNWMN
jgi:hypothetical protein